MFPGCEAYRLYKRGEAGICCDEEGVSLGPIALVTRSGAHYFVGSEEDMRDALKAAYGPLSDDQLEYLARGVVGVARSLNKGDFAVAMIKALHLRLPEIAGERLAKMERAFGKANFNPDEPRDWRGRWTSGVIIGVVSVDGVVAKVHLRGVGDTYLDPKFALQVKKFDNNAHDAGVTLHFNSAYRSPKKQADMRRQHIGLTPAKNSLHSAGLAVDVNYDSLLPHDQKIVREAAAKAGLMWGGNFKYPGPDRRHFYIDPGGDRGKRIQRFSASVSRLKQ